MGLVQVPASLREHFWDFIRRFFIVFALLPCSPRPWGLSPISNPQTPPSGQNPAQPKWELTTGMINLAFQGTKGRRGETEHRGALHELLNGYIQHHPDPVRACR